ncbi:M1 family metallopeptidase [Sphingobium aquiterrae]|uniref:M1 family metallopeptidase n=1 Tax=Sphingobium aquiterrae TaxID=2038656 RepID=UPI0030159315
MKRRLLSLMLCGAAALCGAGTAFAQRQVAASITDPNDPKYVTEQTRKMGGVMPPEQLALVFDHLDLALKVFPDRQRVEGDVTLNLHTKAQIGTLILDFFPKFAISAIYLDGKKLAPGSYANPEGQLRIALARPIKAGTSFAARVVYAGTPPLAKRPPWEGGTTWMKTPDGKYPWIDTSLWGGGCDMLYPCLDHPTLKPATSDLHYTVPAGLMAPGNGALVSKVEKDGWTTWNWHARSIHTYGSVLDVGPYKVMEGDYKSRFGNVIPMRFYYLPGEEKQAAELFAEFPQTLDFWENMIGPYPWADQKMGVIRVPYSGLENQTLIGYSNDYPKTPYGWDWLMNHEFSHEWFANQLSNANYDDLWLHEGLGSYAQPLIAQYLGGEIDYMAQLKPQRAGIRNEMPLVSGQERPEKAVYADPTGPRGDIYTKGSWVAHTLRGLIGDEAFFKAIRILVYGRPDPKPGNFTPQFGTTQGFLKIVNDVTGKDYKWFFDVYLYRAALPKLVAMREGGMLKLHWQTPDNLPFPMPVDVRVDGKTVTLPMADGTGAVPATAQAGVTIDPNSKILMQSDAIDKYQAWRAAQPAARAN